MDQRFKRQVGTIPTTDRQGRTVVIHQVAEILRSSTLNEPTSDLEVSRELVTKEGYPVNDNGDGTFTVVHTGQMLTRG